MEAIILAGGLGTRLKNVVHDVPKPMAPVGGKPFMEHLLQLLERKGFSEIIISTCYMAEAVSDYFGTSFNDLSITYVVEQQPLGTGGATRLALQECKNDHVYIFNGDTIIDLEVDLVEQKWNALKLPIIVGVNVQDTSRYGCLLVKDNRLVGFKEKQNKGAGLINAGCYVMPRGALDVFQSNYKFSLERFLETEVFEGCMEIFETNGEFIDIGIPEDYSRAWSVIEPILSAE